MDVAAGDPINWLVCLTRKHECNRLPLSLFVDDNCYVRMCAVHIREADTISVPHNERAGSSDSAAIAAMSSSVPGNLLQFGGEEVGPRTLNAHRPPQEPLSLHLREVQAHWIVLAIRLGMLLNATAVLQGVPRQ